MLQTRTTRWAAAAAALCVLLLVATWFLLVSPRRAHKDEVVATRVQAEDTNVRTRSEIAQLVEQARTLPNRQADLSALQEQMPPATNMPRMVRDLDRLATASGVVLNEITPGSAIVVDGGTASATAGAPAAGAAAAGGAGAEDGGAAAPGAGVAAGGTGAAAGGAASLASNRLVAVPIQVVSEGDYFEQAVFIKKLQTEMKRAFLILQTNITSPAQDSAGIVTLTLKGQIYVFQTAGSPQAPLSLPDSATTPTPGAGGQPTPTAGGTQGTVPATPGGTTPGATATSSPTAVEGGTGTSTAPAPTTSSTAATSTSPAVGAGSVNTIITGDAL